MVRAVLLTSATLASPLAHIYSLWCSSSDFVVANSPTVDYRDSRRFKADSTERAVASSTSPRMMALPTRISSGSSESIRRIATAMLRPPMSSREAVSRMASEFSSGETAPSVADAIIDVRSLRSPMLWPVRTRPLSASVAVASTRSPSTLTAMEVSAGRGVPYASGSSNGSEIPLPSISESGRLEANRK